MLQQDFGLFNYQFPQQASIAIVDKHGRLLQNTVVQDCGVATLDQVRHQVANSEFNIKNYERVFSLQPIPPHLPTLYLSFTINSPQEVGPPLQARIIDTLNRVQLVQQSYKYRQHQFTTTVLLSCNLFKKDYDAVLQSWGEFLQEVINRTDLVEGVLTTCHYQFDISFFAQVVEHSEKQALQIQALQNMVEQQQTQLNEYTQIIQDYRRLMAPPQ